MKKRSPKRNRSGFDPFDVQSGIESRFRGAPISSIETSIGARFQEQAAANPNHICIAHESQQVSYAQVNNFANHIAYAVRSWVGDATCIALMMEKGSELVMSIVGILKAGGFYLALDPELPDGRLDFMIGDAGAVLILADRRHIKRASLLANDRTRVVDIEEIGGFEPTDDPPWSVSPSSLAYILYTSGSTGAPKGVIQNHRNVLHYTRNYANSLELEGNDRVSLLGSFSFGASAMDMFVALLQRSRLVAVRSKKAWDYGVSPLDTQK